MYGCRVSAPKPAVVAVRLSNLGEFSPPVLSTVIFSDHNGAFGGTAKGNGLAESFTPTVSMKDVPKNSNGWYYINVPRDSYMHFYLEAVVNKETFYYHERNIDLDSYDADTIRKVIIVRKVVEQMY